MTLGIYRSPVETSKIESTDYLSLTFDGTIGGSIDTKLYIRNEDITLWYSNIQVQPYESGTTLNVVSGPAWEMRVLEKDIPPTTEEWLAVSAGNQITLSSNIGNNLRGDISIYLPFWVRTTTPRDQQARNITSIVLRIDAIKHLVGA